MRYLAMWTLIFSIFGCSSLSRAVEFFTTYELGGAHIVIGLYERQGGMTFFVPHDDENTSIEAAKSYIDERGGRLIYLMHTGERNIAFSHDGIRYRFDPNRMFTEGGISESLQAHGQSSDAAHALIREFARQVLVHISAGGLRTGTLVALHNNSDGGYSLLSYSQGGDLQKEAESISIGSAMDPDDFLFLTSHDTFQQASSRNLNVVLQAVSATDDGSLSVYCAQHRIEYVNVEAQHGHYNEQLLMLRSLSLF